MKPPRLLVSVPNPRLGEAVAADHPEVEVIDWSMASPAPLDRFDIVVPPYLVGPVVLKQLAGVSTRLVQSQSVGYDGVREVLPPGHVFANAAGVHETSTAELALALILASQRGLPDFVRDAQRGEWHSAWHPSLADRTVLLVGFGGVNQAVEARLLPFETKVIRIARTPRSDERGVIHGLASLPELLPLADIVVVAVPLSESTTHLIDGAFLSAIRDGGLLVNISRGSVADTEALLAHASTGRIRLALDVTDPEPLPLGHPLLALANVIVTPHVGGMTSAMLPRMARLIGEQIDRMVRGDEPANVVLRS